MIAYRVRERDALRQIRYARLMHAVARHLSPDHGGLLSGEALEFGRVLATAAVGFWLMGMLLESTLEVNPLYTFAVAGAVYSLQATYHKHRLARDPNYEIPRCGCAGRQRGDRTEQVLTSRESTVLGVPTSVFGALFYCAVAVLTHFGQAATVTPLAACAVSVSAYLTYVMVRRIGSLCPDCVNVTALNILILVQVLF